MGRDLVDLFQSSDRLTARWKSKPFPPSEVIVKLIAKLFDINDVPHKLNVLDEFEIQRTWKRHGENTVMKVTEVSMEIIVVPLIENVHMEDDLDIYVDSRVKCLSLALNPLCLKISNFLVGKFPISEWLVIALV
jgi:hypothetical protein